MHQKRKRNQILQAVVLCLLVGVASAISDSLQYRANEYFNHKKRMIRELDDANLREVERREQAATALRRALRSTERRSRITFDRAVSAEGRINRSLLEDSAKKKPSSPKGRHFLISFLSLAVLGLVVFVVSRRTGQTLDREKSQK